MAGGTLVLPGLLARVAAVPLPAVLAVAIATTALPTLVGNGFGTTAHESRTDVPLLAGSLFLLLAGGGRWFLDLLVVGRVREPLNG